jgi:dihydropteridine reductase
MENLIVCQIISELVKNADLMWRQSVWSSTIAASIAAQYLKDGGLVSLPGAKPALGPTPGKMMHFTPS